MNISLESFNVKIMRWKLPKGRVKAALWRVKYIINSLYNTLLGEKEG